jgi:hypothetical protein
MALGLLTNNGFNQLQKVGGIAGTLDRAGGVIRRCANFMKVENLATTSHYTGGIVGHCHEKSLVEDSYNAGAIRGTNAGGVLGRGYNTGCSLVRVLNWGPVNGAAPQGAIQGSNSVTPVEAHYDNQTSVATGSGTGHTTAWMQTAANFPSATWITSVWSFKDGRYPRLKMEE